ncbi:MAG: hypothetical protein M3461_08715, partial [Pseudomonadota bacterium]|nr:hypothetical protein [Pseudomonadota bacterium]
MGGGVERGPWEFAHELVRCGHRALVIAAPGRLAQAIVEAGAEHIPWAVAEKSARVLRYLAPLRRWGEARFAALSLELKPVFPTIFLLGGEAERDVATAIATHHPDEGCLAVIG